ncbi:MAG TPA: hypothetical protein V6C78_31395 [Crinalium sp.]|jgi:hypothetical protein
MNNALKQNIYQADGRYFTDVELGVLDGYCQTYPARLQTYNILCEKADTLVEQALQKLAQTDGAVVTTHKEACVRDMNYVLRSVAIAILKDDHEGFRQQLVLWMQNIMAALRKEAQSAKAYMFLQDVVKVSMPVESAKLVNDTLDEFIRALTVGA